jgi:hypothetical protein
MDCPSEKRDSRRTPGWRCRWRWSLGFRRIDRHGDLDGLGELSEGLLFGGAIGETGDIGVQVVANTIAVCVRASEGSGDIQGGKYAVGLEGLKGLRDRRVGRSSCGGRLRARNAEEEDSGRQQNLGEFHDRDTRRARGWGRGYWR